MAYIFSGGAFGTTPTTYDVESFRMCQGQQNPFFLTSHPPSSCEQPFPTTQAWMNYSQPALVQWMHVPQRPPKRMLSQDHNGARDCVRQRIEPHVDHSTSSSLCPTQKESQALSGNELVSFNFSSGVVKNVDARPPVVDTESKPTNHRKKTQTQRRRRRKKPNDCSSGFHGVSWHKRDRRWVARVWINGKIKHVGNFTSEVCAAIAVDDLLLATFGNDTAMGLNFTSTEERELARELCKAYLPSPRLEK